MSRCWTCRRRRLKCDGGLPHCQKCLSNGVECLGYTKPLTWVAGVARRGPMKNRSFGESPSPTLTEPLLQDLDGTSRFFVDYFSKRICPVLVVHDHVGNRYREILSLVISSPLIASAISAVSACHYAHSLTGSPLATSSPRRASPPASQVSSLNLSREAVVERYLQSKANCLKLLSVSMHDQSQRGEEPTFIAVILLAVLDLVESGSGSWIFHLEGAKKLLEAGNRKGRPEFEKGPRTLLHELVLFQAFGSSLTRPGVLTSVADFQFTPAASSLSPIACPVQIVRGVEEFASQRKLEVANIDVLQHTLETMRRLDVSEWAGGMMQDASAPAYKDLLHLGIIWKLAAEIYACRILRNVTGDRNVVLPPVENLTNAYAFLDREDDELIKCLIWPTFIAGASSINVATRNWALRTLDRIWAVALLANVKNAAQVLTSLWEKQDRMTSRSLQANATASFDWNWIGELEQLEHSWLFV